MTSLADIVQVMVGDADHRAGLKLKQRYSMAGLVVGGLCVLGGAVLLLNGVAGSTSWTAEFLGARSAINDAAPGTVFALIGFFVVLVTRFKVRETTYSEERRVHDPTTGLTEIKIVKR